MGNGNVGIYIVFKKHWMCHTTMVTATAFSNCHASVLSIASFPDVKEGEEKECLVHTVYTCV